jgi:hypothetical protein
MSNYDDFLKAKPTKSGRKNKTDKNLIWNLLTGLMLLMTLCACGFFVSLIRDPYSSLNPFAPNTLVPPPATATWTPISYAATWTPTVTLPPTNTSTPRPTFTLVSSPTAFTVSTSTPNFTPTTASTSTRTPRPTGAPYSITVTYNESTTIKADTSCSSMYVAGQTLNAKNGPVIGLSVKLGGGVPGKTFVPALITLTGIDRAYGQSGFEFNLKVAPVASSQSLWVQLVDQSDAPLSEQYKLTTYADCKKNLILIRFQQK